MELKEKLDQLHNRVDGLKENIATEEATKNAFIMPFIQLLGYDIFNPTEVVPEFNADLGTKKNEKVDYAIIKDNLPILIIECKHWKEKLDGHHSQLHRYFTVTKSRFAILTNGIKYEFYTDLEKSNIMDSKPFLTVDLDDLRETTAKELAKFQKESFNIDTILSSANSLKYISGIKNEFKEQLESPSKELTKILVANTYEGMISSKKMLKFQELTKIALGSFISDAVTSKLTTALNNEVTIAEGEIEETSEPLSKVITTEEELEAFQIVKAILRQKVSSNKIHHRDTQSYFGILYENNNRKPICRLYLDGKQKRIGFFNNGDRKEVRVNIDTIDDIYQYTEELQSVLDIYLN